MDITDILNQLDAEIDRLRKSRDIEGQDYEDTADTGREYGETYNCGWLEGAAHELSQLRKKIAEAS